VLVTGASGFLGRALVKHLVGAGADVRSLSRRAPPDLAAGEVGGDIRDPVAMARAMIGVSAVIHAAGLAHVFGRGDDAAFRDVNERGTDVVARAAVAAGVRHFVHVSSVAVYGSPGVEAREGDECRPSTAYARSKAAAEACAIAAARGGMRVTILRMATLYGEGDRGNVQRLLRALDRGWFVPLGSGANRKSLLFVADAARACALPIGPAGAAVEVYNVAAPPVPMRSVVAGLADALGKPVPRWHVPAWLALASAVVAAAVVPSRGRLLQQTLAKWLADDVYPADEFVRRFGFQPQTTLQEGLRRQVRWWRASTGG
jgi:nucleoside-diphosphate-sugar epimerase